MHNLSLHQPVPAIASWSWPKYVPYVCLQVPFVPLNNRLIKWYNCGPTVYDHSHMGHARSYITFDIIRRILQDYFGYQVFFVQNVTDIDDKIIRRARQRHLFREYAGKVERNEITSKSVRAQIEQAIALMQEKLNNESNLDKKCLLERTLKSASGSVNNTSLSPIDLVNECRDVLSEYLDVNEGSSVSDLSIFTTLTKEFEDEYNQDMKALNVLRPSVVSRVSEYVPEIIEFIEKIIGNGYAYESNGSVYFDVKAFDSGDGKGKHTYAKLVHEAVGDLSALNEGEGDLSVHLSEKKNAADFVLWKKSKPGEPRWNSPWGEGRPGWHIECSVMATQLLGETFDIHSGGIDLRFPHHDNEIAQSEAYFDTGKDWVQFFLHSGHLTISGCKMSKSLKNFITIKEALKDKSCRQMRFLFLLHHWQDTLNYSADTLADAVSYEKKVFEFFLNVKNILRVRTSCEKMRGYRKWGLNEISLNEEFIKCRDKVDEALCDNLDTKSVLVTIKDLINQANIYIKGNCSTCNFELLEDIAKFVSFILRVFGLVDHATREANFEPSSVTCTGSTGSSESTLNVEDHVMPFLQVLADFRAEIRAQGISAKNQAILAACDRLRDDILPNLGVRFEDPDSTSSPCSATSIKLVDREILMKERAEKKRLEEEKYAEKMRRKKELEEKEAKNRMDPKEWVVLEFPRDKFSAFDEKGLPTHELDGKEISKGQRKKMSKAYETQERRFREYTKALNGTDNLTSTLAS